MVSNQLRIGIRICIGIGIEEPRSQFDHAYASGRPVNDGALATVDLQLHLEQT